jgi:hypothetical protein
MSRVTCLREQYSFGTRKHWRLMACFTKTTWQTASHWSVAVASLAQRTMMLLRTWPACGTKWQRECVSYKKWMQTKWSNSYQALQDRFMSKCICWFNGCRVSWLTHCLFAKHWQKCARKVQGMNWCFLQSRALKIDGNYQRHISSCIIASARPS